MEKLKEENISIKKELQEMSKLVKEKLKPDEEEEKELQVYECIREKKYAQEEEENNNIINKNNTPQGKYISTNIFMIYIYLYNEKIKVRISKIQDNLKSNPLIYESSFIMND